MIKELYNLLCAHAFDDSVVRGDFQFRSSQSKHTKSDELEIAMIKYRKDQYIAFYYRTVSNINSGMCDHFNIAKIIFHKETDRSDKRFNKSEELIRQIMYYVNKEVKEKHYSKFIGVDRDDLTSPSEFFIQKSIFANCEIMVDFETDLLCPKEVNKDSNLLIQFPIRLKIFKRYWASIILNIKPEDICHFTEANLYISKDILYEEKINSYFSYKRHIAGLNNKLSLNNLLEEVKEYLKFLDKMEENFLKYRLELKNILGDDFWNGKLLLIELSRI